MKRRTIKALLIGTLLLSTSAHGEDAKPTMEKFEQIHQLIKGFNCPSAKHVIYKEELKAIFEGDKSDRVNSNPKMSDNDITRRTQVATIAAESCLKDKDDYWMASLVFQHGVLPEHYLQAFLYANKSLALGHENGGLREAAIDRYLMSLGRKQIFGTQVSAPVYYKENESEQDLIPCLWPVETEINLVKDYDYKTPEYRLALKQNIIGMKKAVPECDFPASSSKGVLDILLNLKI